MPSPASPCGISESAAVTVCACTVTVVGARFPLGLPPSAVCSVGVGECVVAPSTLQCHTECVAPPSPRAPPARPCLPQPLAVVSIVRPFPQRPRVGVSVSPPTGFCHSGMCTYGFSLSFLGSFLLSSEYHSIIWATVCSTIHPSKEPRWLPGFDGCSQVLLVIKPPRVQAVPPPVTSRYTSPLKGRVQNSPAWSPSFLG